MRRIQIQRCLVGACDKTGCVGGGGSSATENAQDPAAGDVVGDGETGGRAGLGDEGTVMGISADGLSLSCFLATGQWV